MIKHDSQSLLEIRDIGISFGGLRAVDDFSLQIQPRELQGLIGPNGAGKTTCFNLLTGVYQPDQGSFQLNGIDLRGNRPSQITRAGIARTFQNIRLFANLSVIENVLVACHLRSKQSLMSAILHLPSHLKDEMQMEQKGMELLSRFGLADRADEPSSSLAYGDQRKLEIARALATDPKVLLLDEPAAGMNPQEKIELKKLIAGLLDQFNIAILLIEHDMGVVMDLCQKITVLDHGSIIATGTPAEIQCNEKVIEAYLGTPNEEGAADER